MAYYDIKPCFCILKIATVFQYNPPVISFGILNTHVRFNIAFSIRMVVYLEMTKTGLSIGSKKGLQPIWRQAII